LSHVVECIRDHVHLLHDLPNDTTLSQEMVASSIFLVTEILTIEDYKLKITFLQVTIGS
jgi:REP element-mobilizing transposase RayT